MQIDVDYYEFISAKNNIYMNNSSVTCLKH
jgi:hypothetical protein